MAEHKDEVKAADAQAAAALLFPDDSVVQKIMAQVHKPAEMRLSEAQEWLKWKRQPPQG